MSLRTEIRDAVDEVTPPSPALLTQVEAFVEANTPRRVAPSRHRPNRWRNVMRGSLALAAVFLLIALVAAVFVGGRVVQDWNSIHKPVPAGPPHATLGELEARPLQLPQVAAGAPCPDGPQISVGVYGKGPFYGDATIASGPYKTERGIYWDLEGETDRTATGLMLVRAIDMKTRQQYVFAGQYAAGPAAWPDVVHGQNVQTFSELVLDMSHRPATTHNGKTTWPFLLGVPLGNSGCYGWQIDGDNFTETMVFDAGITS